MVFSSHRSVFIGLRRNLRRRRLVLGSSFVGHFLAFLLVDKIIFAVGKVLLFVDCVLVYVDVDGLQLFVGHRLGRVDVKASDDFFG